MADGSTEPTEALAAVVARLRGELAGVRTAMRSRAVIEQAKGVLVERLGITPDEGFDHLVRLSQRANVKLIEVAAAIVGTTAPDPQAPAVTELTDHELRAHVGQTAGRNRVSDATQPPPAAGGARRGGPSTTGRRGGGQRPRPPAQEALQAQHQLLSARIASATGYDEIAETVMSASEGWPPPAVVVITLLRSDGAQQFVGAAGMSTQDRAQWQLVPPVVELPVVAAVRDRRSVLALDRAALIAHFPALAEVPYQPQAVFTAPLLDADHVIGALGLSWRQPIEVSTQARHYLSALAGPVARRVAELVSGATEPSRAAPEPAIPPDDSWLSIVLETTHHPAFLLTPVHDGGKVIDFRVEYANGPARELITAERLDPRDVSLLALYPQVGSEVLLPELARLITDGRTVQLGPVRSDPGTGSTLPGKPITVRASRLWDRVLLIWRGHDESELLHPQLLEAERIARIGSFTWDLHTGERQGSPQLYRLIFGDERPRQVPVPEMIAAVHQDDLFAAQEAVRRMLVNGKQLNVEFRGAGRLSGRRLRLTAEPVTDDDGAVVTVRGTMQDVTEERAIQARLRLAEEALAAQRRRLDAELRAAQTLQQALLPTEPELGTTEGLTVRGRCRSADKTGRVDGDWYDATALPGGATLLVVGDVAGSGLAALTAAARLRYAVRAYAALDMSPGQILDAANAMLCSLEPERTASIAIARYTPHDHRLAWAAAGRGAPVRYPSAGGGYVLPGPQGLPAGTYAENHYEDSAIVLEPGDRVLLYTDGLIGVGGLDATAALDVIRAARNHADLGDLEELVAHLVDALHGRPDEDMGAMLVRVTG